MSERLRQLQRQQTLLREHLAWIESEIARETPSATAQPAPAPASTAPVDSPSAIAPATPSPSEADALLEKYAGGERQNPADLRRGCFIIFASALGLLAAGVTILWLVFYR